MGAELGSTPGIPIDVRRIKRRLKALGERQWEAQELIFAAASQAASRWLSYTADESLRGQTVKKGLELLWIYDGRIFTAIWIDVSDKPDLYIDCLVSMRSGKHHIFIPLLNHLQPRMIASETSASFLMGSAWVHWAGPTAACLQNAYAVPAIGVSRAFTDDPPNMNGGHNHSPWMTEFDDGSGARGASSDFIASKGKNSAFATPVARLGRQQPSAKVIICTEQKYRSIEMSFGTFRKMTLHRGFDEASRDGNPNSLETLVFKKNRSHTAPGDRSFSARRHSSSSDNVNGGHLARARGGGSAGADTIIGMGVGEARTCGTRWDVLGNRDDGGQTKPSPRVEELTLA